MKSIIDNRYMGYLLLEALYFDGKLNLGTYERILKSKEKYIQSQKNHTKVSRNKKAA